MQFHGHQQQGPQEQDMGAPTPIRDHRGGQRQDGPPSPTRDHAVAGPEALRGQE